MEKLLRSKKIFVAGGTGFLGAPSAEKLRECGAEVRSASLSGGYNCDKVDLFSESEEALTEYFAGIGVDALVYALGPDDRCMPPAPAYAFFRDRLVGQSLKICRAAKRAGVKKIAVMGSYFAYFDRKFGGSLAKNHPYIRARAEQERVLLALNDAGCEVFFLELPYIFGVTEGRVPIWRESFLSHYDGFGSVFITRGGTAATTVEGVAETAAAAVICGEGGACYPVGGVNIEYKTLLEKMLFYADDARKVRIVPAWAAALGAKKIKKEYARAGKESGLDPSKLMTQIQNRYFYIDAGETERRLRFKDLGFTPVREIDESIRLSMRACYPERFDGAR